MHRWLTVLCNEKIVVHRDGGYCVNLFIAEQYKNNKKLWDEMSECPHCGSSTMWNENHIELCCTNPSCPGVQLAKIIFFYLCTSLRSKC